MKIPKAKKLPSGAWRIQVMLDGHRVSRTFRSEREAVAWATSIKAGLIEPQSAPKRTTLSAAIDTYIESNDRILSPSTIRGYRAIQHHRFPKLMGRDVYQITKLDVQQAVNKEAGKVSPKTLKNAVGLVVSVLSMCGVKIEGIKLPIVVKPKKSYLQPDDVGKLIQAAEGDQCEVQILLAVWMGLRRSEIYGLCWDCIDLDHSSIYIMRALVPDEHHKWVLKDYPKTSASLRTIPCPQYIMDKIKAMPHTEGRVFRGYPGSLVRHVHTACQRAGIVDSTAHGLRHTNAAVMHYLGVDDAHAMARGGWSSENTYKQVYSYVFNSAATSGDTAIDNFFSGLHTNLHTTK